MRRDWLLELGVADDEMYIIDTKPMPVVGYKRSKSRNYFRGSAASGYCARRKLKYFGYKLVMITTLEGLPVIYDLVSANTYERLLNSVRERIEGVFHELQNIGQYLEHFLPKTVNGLATRVIAKVTAHLLKHILRRRFGIDVQTFQWDADSLFNFT